MAEKQEQSSSSESSEETVTQEETSSTTVESSEFVVSGPNANINIHKGDFKGFIEVFEYAFSKGQATHAERPHSVGWSKDLEKALLGKKEQKATEDASTKVAGNKDFKPLETLDEIADWYEGLQETAMHCLVQTVASLHGAMATDIARLTKTLQPPEVSEATDSQGKSIRSARPLSDRELFRHTLVERKRIGGNTRLFWKDLDSTGQLRFTLLVLRYLAEEQIFSSGPDLEETLQAWAENETHDCAWRAARALGIILFWRSSTQSLWRLANTWANGERVRDWRNAASLLSGAYSVEWLEDEKRAQNPKQSDILRLLNQWVERAQNPDGWRVGCAAAETYDLLDRFNPHIALDGIEGLLRLPGSGVSSNWESISRRLFSFCLSNYVSIAWSNHIRIVLTRLAHFARTLVYQPERPENLDEDLRYYGQCELQLEAIFSIFFLVAASSFEDEPTEAHYSLSEALNSEPLLPDEQGRDILLAGILTAPEEIWRQNITAVLSSAFFAEKESEALYILRRWAYTVEAITEAGTVETPFVTAYQHFIFNLYETIRTWEADPERTGFNTAPASAIFAYQLSSWTEQYDWDGNTNSDFLRSFTQNILIQVEGR